MIHDNFAEYVAKCRSGGYWNDWILFYYLRQEFEPGTFPHQIVSRASSHLEPHVSTVEQYFTYIDRPVEERLAAKERDREFRAKDKERAALRANRVIVVPVDNL